MLLVKPEVQDWFNGQTMSSYAALFGIFYTPPCKTDSWEKYKIVPLEKMGFCSILPTRCDWLPGIRWIAAPSDLQALVKSAKWIRKGQPPDQALVQNLEGILRRCVSLGPSLYKRYFDDFRSSCSAVGINTTFLNFSSACTAYLRRDEVIFDVDPVVPIKISAGFQPELGVVPQMKSAGESAGALETGPSDNPSNSASGVGGTGVSFNDPEHQVVAPPLVVDTRAALANPEPMMDFGKVFGRPWKVSDVTWDTSDTPGSSIWAATLPDRKSVV